MTKYALFQAPVDELKRAIGILISSRIGSDLAMNTGDNFRQAWDVCIASSAPATTPFSNNFVEAVLRFAALIGDVVHSGGAIKHAAKLQLTGKSRSKTAEINDFMACLFSGAIIDDISYQAGVSLRDFITKLLDQSQSKSLYNELNNISKDIKTLSGHLIDFPAVLTRLNQELTKSIAFYELNKPNEFYKKGSFHQILEEKKAEYESTKNDYIVSIEGLKAKFEQQKQAFSSLSPVQQRESFDQEKADQQRITEQMDAQMASFHQFVAERHTDEYLDYDWFATTLEHMNYLVVSSGHHETLMRFIATNPTISLSPCYVFSLHVTQEAFGSLTSDIFGEFNEGFIRVADKLYHTINQRNGLFKSHEVESIDLNEYDENIPRTSQKEALSSAQIGFIVSKNKVKPSGYQHVLKFAQLFGTSREHLDYELHDFYAQSEQQRRATKFDRKLEKLIARYKTEVDDFAPSGKELEEYSAAIGRRNAVMRDISQMNTKLLELSAHVEALREETSSLEPEKLKLLSHQVELEAYNQAVLDRKEIKGAKNIDVTLLLGSDKLIDILGCSEKNSTLIRSIYDDSKVRNPLDILKGKFGTPRISLETIVTITTLISAKIETIRAELKTISDKEEILSQLDHEKSTLESEIVSKQADGEVCTIDVQNKERSLYSVTREVYLKDKYVKKMGLFALSVKNKRLETIARDLQESLAMLSECNSTSVKKIQAKIRVLAAHEPFFKIGIDEEGTQVAEDITAIKDAKTKLELYVKFDEIHQDYFNQNDGVFPSNNRPNTNQGCIAAILGSLFESLAALFFSCFSYQSEAAFLATLEAAGEVCQKDCFNPGRHEALNKLIDDRVRDYPFDGTRNRNQLSRKLGEYKDDLKALYQPTQAISSLEIDSQS